MNENDQARIGGFGSLLDIVNCRFSFIYNFLIEDSSLNDTIKISLESSVRTLRNLNFRGFNVEEIGSLPILPLLRPYLFLNNRFWEFDGVERAYPKLTISNATFPLRWKVKIFENGIGILRIDLAIDSAVKLTIENIVSIMNMGERSNEENLFRDIKICGTVNDDSINTLSKLYENVIKILDDELGVLCNEQKKSEEDAEGDVFAHHLCSLRINGDVYFARQSPYPLAILETSGGLPRFKQIFKQETHLKSVEHDPALISEVLSLIFRSITVYHPHGAFSLATPGFNMALCDDMGVLRPTRDGWRLAGFVTEDIAFADISYRAALLVRPSLDPPADDEARLENELQGDNKTLVTIEKAFRETIELIRLRWYVNCVCEFLLDKQIQSMSKDLRKITKLASEYNFLEKMKRMLEDSIKLKAFFYKLLEDPAIHRIGAGAFNWLYGNANRLFRMIESEEINFEKIRAIDRLHDEMWELARVSDALRTQHMQSLNESRRTGEPDGSD